MSSYIDLVSSFRDREQFPNSADYTVTEDQVSSWFTAARTVRGNPQKAQDRLLEFATSVKLLVLTVPFSPTLALQPRLYVDFHCRRYEDLYLINTISGFNRDARFVCVLDRIQVDDNGNSVWMHYRSNMDQVLRFRRKDPVVFRIFTVDGVSINPGDNLIPQPLDPFKQTLATFEVTPYIRDEHFSNQLLETITT
jgi:hypothetical protein